MKIALCFPGQGSQVVGMGREFAESVPESAAVYDEASAVTGLDLRRLCFEGPIEELTETAVQQPALVATSLACLAALSCLGVEPSFAVGHSVGEYSALAASKALSRRDAIWLVRQRGLVTAAAADATPGAMAAVIGLEDEVVESLCAGIDGVWPANYNCPGQVVVSGTEASVDRLLSEAIASGARRTIPLRITGAFHSPLVAAAAAELAPSIDRVKWRRPAIPFFSTVTGQVEPENRLASLLLDQLTSPVRFTQSIRRLAAEGVRLFVEVGPGQVLAGLIRRIDPSATAVSIGDPASLRTLEEVLSTR